jgi:hypothetical protein
MLGRILIGFMLGIVYAKKSHTINDFFINSLDYFADSILNDKNNSIY